MSNIQMNSEEAAQGRPFGPSKLNLRIGSDISKGNMLTLLFGSFFGIAMMGFVNASQPYLFTEVLGIPQEDQGPLAGNLTFWSEVVVIIWIGLVGAMSDKLGRKPIWAVAFFIFAVGYFLYPLAQTVGQLTAFRVLFALGLAMNTAMLPSVINDYAVEESRGRMIAVCFMLNGLGFILLLTPLRLLLPFYQELTGNNSMLAARYWLWTPAAVCLMVSTVLLLGLKSGAPAQLEKREPLLATLRIGLKAAKDIRVAFAYFTAIVARGDMAVLSTFFVLWLSQKAMAEGMPTAEASVYALKFYILIQVFALIWLPIMGFILDRVDRVVGVAIAMVLAASGYTSLYLITDPLGMQMWIAAVIVGMGEMSANLATLTLIGSVAPEKGRGAVIGLFSLCGAIGILMIAKFGGMASGYYNDNIAPFVLIAMANCAVLVVAMIVLKITRNSPP
ncbi:MAG: MFS transporter, partial [Gammaproteobacteria bacterium]|nr:MFS transporter [Gammaproteobacteria bacterium]